MRVPAIIAVCLLAIASLVDAGKNNAQLLLDVIYPLQVMRADAAGNATARTFCTAYAINKEVGGLGTDAHCILNDETLAPIDEQVYIGTVDGPHPVEIFRVDEEKDLTLLKLLDDFQLKRTLKLAKQGPKAGDRIETAGYAYALGRPFYFLGFVSVEEFLFESRQLHYEWYGTFVNMVSVGGQSGSPIVNERGELIGQLHIGFGGTGEADPITGITAFSTMQEWDNGWVYER